MVAFDFSPLEIQATWVGRLDGPHFLESALHRRVANFTTEFVHIEAHHAAEKAEIDPLVVGGVVIIAVG